MKIDSGTCDLPAKGTRKTSCGSVAILAQAIWAQALVFLAFSTSGRPNGLVDKEWDLNGCHRVPSAAVTVVRGVAAEEYRCATVPWVHGVYDLMFLMELEHLRSAVVNEMRFFGLSIHKCGVAFSGTLRRQC